MSRTLLMEPVPVGQAFGVQGFVSAVNYQLGPAVTPMPGSVGGFYASVSFHYLAKDAVVTRIFASDAPASGWALLYNGGSLSLQAKNGVGAQIASPQSATVAGDVGKVIQVTGVFDATGALLRLYRAGIEIGAGAAIVGYTPDNNRASIGSKYDGTQPSTTMRIVGALYGTGIPQPADILAHYNACKAANTMESMGGAGVTNVNRWQARDNAPNGPTWTDDIGGMVLTKTGTLETVSFPPFWE